MSSLDRLQARLEVVDRELSQEFGDQAPGRTEAANAKLHGSLSDFRELAAQLQKGTLQDRAGIFGFLRRVIPILVVDQFALVTRFDDVQEVLAHDGVFEVPYKTKFGKLLGGRNFFLGMSKSAEYDRDVANMRMVVRPEDLVHVGELVEKLADPVLGKVATAPGRVDVVKFAAAVATAVVGEYFGAPNPSDAEAVAKGSGLMLAYLFLQADDPQTEAAAIAAAKALRHSLQASLDARKRDRGKRDDVLERCLKLNDAKTPGMDDVSIIDNLFGLIVGAIPTTAAMIARAVDELLRRPKELANAHAAATQSDHELVRQYVFEAIRFNALTAGVFRTATEDYTFARGTPAARVIPKGTSVLAALQSAMLDGDRIEAPEQFRLGRPPHHYMHFGYGLHTCFGQHMSDVQIPRIARALLRRPNLRRAAGVEGTLQLVGSFPKSLVVEFEPDRVAAR